MFPTFRREKHIFIGTIFFFPIFLTALLLSPQEVEALRIADIFTPFGGKVISWLPEAPGCAAITAAVTVATLGTVNITVEELKVGPPKSATVGILRVNGFPLPFLTGIYDTKTYFTPGVEVLGNSANVCDICGKVGDKVGVKAKVKNIAAAKTICKIGVVKNIIKAGCGLIGGACPLTNLVHKIGNAPVPSL